MKRDIFNAVLTCSNFHFSRLIGFSWEQQVWSQEVCFGRLTCDGVVTCDREPRRARVWRLWEGISILAPPVNDAGKGIGDRSIQVQQGRAR